MYIEIAKHTTENAPTHNVLHDQHTISKINKHMLSA